MNRAAAEIHKREKANMVIEIQELHAQLEYQGKKFRRTSISLSTLEK